MATLMRHTASTTAAGRRRAAAAAVTFTGIGKMTPPGYGTSWSIPAPNGVAPANGTYLIAVIQDNSGSGPGHVTPPSGWTNEPGLSGYFETGFTSFYVFRKRAGASEPSSYTFTSAGSDPKAGFIVGYSGVSASTPHDATTTSTTNQAGPTVTTPSVTTVTDAALHLAFVISANGASLGTLATPSGYTARSSTAADRFAVYDKVIAVHSATGTKTPVASGFTGSAAGVSIALRPG